MHRIMLTLAITLAVAGIAPAKPAPAVQDVQGLYEGARTDADGKAVPMIVAQATDTRRRFISGNVLNDGLYVPNLLPDAVIEVPIEVDGGVVDSNAAQLAAAGCGVFVAGTAIFGAPSYSEAIAAIRAAAEQGLQHGG